MQLREQVSVPDHVAWQRVHGEVVVLNLHSGTYYSLDAVGADMWEALAETGDADAAHGRLHEKYAVDEDRLRGDLSRYIGQLAEAGILRVGAAAA